MWCWTWRSVAAAVLVCAGGSVAALGQEAPKYDELKKMYDSSVASLKVAREATNVLAGKNEELTKQVAELQKQLEAVTKDRDELQRQATTYAEKTYNLRSFYAAWQEFLKKYPTLNAKWKLFLDTELLKSGSEAPTLAEPEWPFRVEG
jgi:Skp family chaperone for outer membrane proteins